ncbi:hypothetical protein A2U01_0116058, partial [Trifolium medium]|nr:hypothetical protein [Trifolium medium]
ISQKSEKSPENKNTEEEKTKTDDTENTEEKPKIENSDSSYDARPKEAIRSEKRS